MVLISKTKTLKDLEARLSIKSYCEWAKGYDEGLRDAIRVVKCQNHIEAEPVRHGRWVLKAEKGGCLDYHVRANCSECGWDYYSKEGVGNPEFVFSAFLHGNEADAILFVLENAKKQQLFCSCPNCGAKMDGKEKPE